MIDRSILNLHYSTAQKMKFSIKGFFSKCDQTQGDWTFIALKQQK